MEKLFYFLAHSVLVVPSVETSCSEVSVSVLYLHGFRDLLSVKIIELISEKHF